MVLEVLCLMSVTRTRRFLSSVSMSVSFVESFFRSRFFGIVLWSRFLWSRFVVTFRGVMFCGLVLWSQFVVVQARFQTRRSFGIAPNPFREERAKQVTCVGVASAT
jgi:hypothetical protein